MASRSFLIRSPKEEESNAAVRGAGGSEIATTRYLLPLGMGVAGGSGSDATRGGDGGHGDFASRRSEGSRIASCCAACGWFDRHPTEDKKKDDVDKLGGRSHEAVLLGAKNGAIAGTVVAVPTLVVCRVLPWAKANLNYTAQALIISAACVSGFFITADKTILRNARQNTIGKLDKST